MLVIQVVCWWFWGVYAPYGKLGDNADGLGWFLPTHGADPVLRTMWLLHDQARTFHTEEIVSTWHQGGYHLTL